MKDHMTDMSNITILFVDDDDFIRDMIEHVLSSHYPTHKLVFAVDGLDALDKIKEHRPDIIIVDYYMPNLDGFELSKLVLSNNSRSNIIVVSGCLSNEVKALFTEIGVSTFINKPINYCYLFSSIDKISMELICGLQ